MSNNKFGAKRTYLKIGSQVVPFDSRLEAGTFQRFWRLAKEYNLTLTLKPSVWLEVEKRIRNRAWVCDFQLSNEAGNSILFEVKSIATITPHFVDSMRILCAEKPEVAKTLVIGIKGSSDLVKAKQFYLASKFPLIETISLASPLLASKRISNLIE